MFKYRLTLNVAVVFVVCLVFTSVARAQTPQKFVSAKTGKDSTSCTINLPCRTFAAAILQVPSGGEIIALDAGDYGSVTITKSVTIVGPVGGLTGIRISFGFAVEINAKSSDTVVLRGLTLSGPGGQVGLDSGGILFGGSGVLHVENCVINGFHGNGIGFHGAGQLFVKDTIVRNCRATGISIGANPGTATASIDRCRLEKNGEGLAADLNAKVTVRDSIAAGNSNTGFVSRASADATAEINLENCAVTGNKVGVSSIVGIVAGKALIRVSNSTITSNETGILPIQSGSILTRMNNTVEGNAKDGSFTGKFDPK